MIELSDRENFEKTAVALWPTMNACERRWRDAKNQFLGIEIFLTICPELCSDAELLSDVCRSREYGI